MNENNIARVDGVIACEPSFDHESHGEKVYKVFLESERASGIIDEIQIFVPERCVDIKKLKIGEYISVHGQFRSYNIRKKKREADGSPKLLLTLFAKEIVLFDEKTKIQTNNVELAGTLCKKPSCRQTPKGRVIADIALAVNRNYAKSDYIPCILWGRNAKYAESLDVGQKISLSGRIQSRKYTKSLQETDAVLEVRTAYEVSGYKIELVGDVNEKY